MEFDITNIDKKLLVKTLIAHSNTIGLGKEEYKFRKSFGEIVDGINDIECDYILSEYNNSKKGRSHFEILDYYKGKPIKLNFYRNSKGKVLVNTDSYDVRNGKYRFLESMLNTFFLDEIKIIKKGYRQFLMTDLPESLKRNKEQNKLFRELLKNTDLKKDNSGNFWAFNKKAKYQSPIMKLVK